MYELLYIIPAPLTEKDVPNVMKKVKKIIEEMGGKIIEEKNLGNKKLAYPIKQVYRGFYILNLLEINPLKIEKLNKNLELYSGVLRHLITKLPKKRPQKIRKKKISAENKTKNKEEKTNIKKLGKRIDDLFNI
jgi:small subunit ribosomal protein S6